jgi:hypothetical protein
MRPNRRPLTFLIWDQNGDEFHGTDLRMRLFRSTRQGHCPVALRIYVTWKICKDPSFPSGPCTG